MAKNSKAGGGINSRVNVEPKVRVGERGREMRPAGVAQIGVSLGDKATNSSRALTGAVEPLRGAQRPSGSPGSVMLGNQKALDVGKGGVGTGREVMRSGSQSQHGPVAGQPKPAGRDILSEFGREVPGRGRG